jgi:hypothetical protein
MNRDTLPPKEFFDEELEQKNRLQESFIQKHGARMNEIYGAIREGRPIPEPSGESAPDEEDEDFDDEDFDDEDFDDEDFDDEDEEFDDEDEDFDDEDEDFDDDDFEEDEEDE